MSRAWDRRTSEYQRTLQGRAWQAFAPVAFGLSPFYRERFLAAGLNPRKTNQMGDLAGLEPVTERDLLMTSKEPGDAALLVATENLISEWGERRALYRNVLAGIRGGIEGRQRDMEAEYKPFHVHLAGREGLFPVAYTRWDLNLLARAGARMLAVAGVSRQDRVVSVVPFGPTLSFWGIYYSMHGLGAAALHTGGLDSTDWAGAAKALRPTVLVATVDDVPAAVQSLAAAGGGADLRTVLTVGAPLAPSDRAHLAVAVTTSGLSARVVGTYHVPEGRVIWAECRPPDSASSTESFGYHGYPDLEVIEVLDHETGRPVPQGTPGELAYTGLDWRGTCLIRYRTGDLVTGGMTERACPNCGRLVPRLSPSITPAAWQVELAPHGHKLDLRGYGAALAARPDLEAWRVEIVRGRSGDQVVVHVATRGEGSPAVLAEIHEALEKRGGVAPTQIILGSREEVEAGMAAGVSPTRLRDRRR